MAEQLDENEQLDEKKKLARCKVLTGPQSFDPQTYEFDTSFIPADISNFDEVHTTAEMVACLEKNPKIELDAKVIGRGKNGKVLTEFSREEFIKVFKESFKEDQSQKLKESFTGFDNDSSAYGERVGDDFTPLLGGPFYKNMYFYQDYIRMHAQAFYAWTRDPIAKSFINITRDFTLGRGYKVECKDNKAALALWRAFEKANDLENQVSIAALELSIYGELMWYWLPNHDANINFSKMPDDAKKAFIPRVRLIDPSTCVEIITYPEDINRPLAYVLLYPTQYQIYGNVDHLKKVMPTSKFIYRQVPSELIDHIKINVTSGEKRGRSDLMPALGYLKRLRDSVDYSLIALQKQSAWAIDTTVEGSSDDVDAYVDSQTAMKTIAPAGSEFVHTAAVKREFLSNAAGKGSNSDAFSWCLSMACSAVQIPVNYLGTHLSGGQTRASALVATEPVAKKFEIRQIAYERMIKSMWSRVMKWGGLGDVECEVIFPDIMTQDRSQKLKDLALAQTQKWLGEKTVATIAAKELGIDHFNFEDEKATMAKDLPLASPLTTPAQSPTPTAGLSSQDKNKVAQNDRS